LLVQLRGCAISPPRKYKQDLYLYCESINILIHFIILIVLFLVNSY
jgi:hypothetical protein